MMFHIIWTSIESFQRWYEELGPERTLVQGDYEDKRPWLMLRSVYSLVIP
uniref:Uncharacterized protein n=1 Tax=Arundo donax TaxID=35708 RepID=A0A0A9CEK5_ARUDO